MATVKKDIKEESEKIKAVKKIVKKRVSELEDKDLVQTPLSDGPSRLGFEGARGTLFYEFARVVKETEPKVFLFENVRGLLNHDNHRTWHVMHDIFEELGYDVKFRVLSI